MSEENIVDVVNYIFNSIDKYKREHPEVEWEDIREAIYSVNDHYKCLKGEKNESQNNHRIKAQV